MRHILTNLSFFLSRITLKSLASIKTKRFPEISHSAPKTLILENGVTSLNV